MDSDERFWARSRENIYHLWHACHHEIVDSTQKNKKIKNNLMYVKSFTGSP
jgi:hypothetical protein